MEEYLEEFLVENFDIWSAPLKGNQDSSLNFGDDQWRDIAFSNLEEVFDWNTLLPLPSHERFHDSLDVPTIAVESLPIAVESPPCIETQPEQQEIVNIINADNMEDEEKDDEEEHKAKDKSLSRNLVSERNRRKRLNEQLCALRSHVPHVTKMNKRAILTDAIAYLKDILEETTKEEEKLAAIAIDEHKLVPDNDEIPNPELKQCSERKYPEISQIELDMVDNEYFTLKLSCSKEMGVLRRVQKMIESLRMVVTSTSVYPLDEDHMTILSFLHVTKKRIVTVNQVMERVKSTATKMGILIS